MLKKGCSAAQRSHSNAKILTVESAREALTTEKDDMHEKALLWPTAGRLHACQCSE